MGILSWLMKQNTLKTIQKRLQAKQRGYARDSLGLEEVFVFDSKSENRDRAVEAVESVSEAIV